MEKLEIICLDSDILIDFLRGDPLTTEKINQLEEKFELTTTTINLFELYYGAYKSKKADKNVRAVDELTTRFKALKFTNKSSDIAGKILAELEKKGELIDFRDVMVAGIILETNIMLYTRNTEHFKGIKGVNLYQTF